MWYGGRIARAHATVSRAKGVTLVKIREVGLWVATHRYGSTSTSSWPRRSLRPFAIRAWHLRWLGRV
eukprot:13668712-Heterocapsa_arctica.AAC.1